MTTIINSKNKQANERTKSPQSAKQSVFKKLDKRNPHTPLHVAGESKLSALQGVPLFMQKLMPCNIAAAKLRFSHRYARIFSILPHIRTIKQLFQVIKRLP